MSAKRRYTCAGIGPVEEKLALGSVLEEKAEGYKEDEREKEGGDVEEGGQEKYREHFS